MVIYWILSNLKLLPVKDSAMRTRIQITDWKKIFATTSLTNDLYLSTCENSEKNSVRRWATDILVERVTREKMIIIDFVSTRKMHFKNTRYYFTVIPRLKFLKWYFQMWMQIRRNWISSTLLMGSRECYSHPKNMLAVSWKLYITLTVWSSNPTSKHLSQRNENFWQHRKLCPVLKQLYVYITVPN